jgi:HEPN domain-containing protein
MRPPEEVKRDFVHQWLKKAEEDMNAAKMLLSHEGSFLFTVGFHAQQAAEKYLKAYLTWHQVEFSKTHDLGELLDIIADIDPPLAKALENVTTLNPFGVDFRYPGDMPEIHRKDAEQAVELAEKVQAAIVITLEKNIS